MVHFALIYVYYRVLLLQHELPCCCAVLPKDLAVLLTESGATSEFTGVPFCCT